MGDRVRKNIEDALTRLPNEKLRLVLRYIESLQSDTPAGTPGKYLVQFAGCMAKEDADEIERFVEEECERIDYDRW